MSLYPKLEALPEAGKGGTTLWRVLEDVRVKVGPRMYVHVPAGYVSNLGSVPRWARWFVSPSEAGFVGPFVCHDWMCSEDHVDDSEKVNSGYSRWMADCVLYELLCHARVAWHKKWIIWAAVRLYARAKGLK